MPPFTRHLRFHLGAAHAMLDLAEILFLHLEVMIARAFDDEAEHLGARIALLRLHRFVIVNPPGAVGPVGLPLQIDRGLGVVGAQGGAGQVEASLLLGQGAAAKENESAHQDESQHGQQDLLGSSRGSHDFLRSEVA